MGGKRKGDREIEVFFNAISLENKKKQKTNKTNKKQNKTKQEEDKKIDTEWSFYIALGVIVICIAVFILALFPLARYFRTRESRKYYQNLEIPEDGSRPEVRIFFNLFFF